MAITAERLEVDVQADTSGARRDLDSFNRHVTTSTTKAGNSATGMGKKFSAAGALMKAAAGTMVASLAGSTIMAASDLNEVLSKTGVVFGPAAKVVTDAADRMADKFGMSKTVFLDAASGMGLVGKAAGYTKREAANLGVGFSKLAADAASFHNVPIEEALAAMKSGLTGEAEPLRRFGVLLSEAAVQTEAVRMGLIKQGDEMTEGQKVQARASLITKGMADAQGDLARTQGSVANRLKEIRGRLTNFAATMGAKALPAVEWFLAAVIKAPRAIAGTIKAIRDWATGSETIAPILGLVRTAVGALVEAVTQLPAIFSKVNGAVQGFIDRHAWAKPVLEHAAVAVGAFVTALLAVMAVQKVIAVITALKVAVLAFNASLMANPIGLIVAALVALAAVVYVAYQRFEPFRNLVDGIAASLKNGLGVALDWVKAKWVAWGPTIIKVVQGLWTGIQTYLRLMMTYWKLVFTVVSTVVKVAFDLIMGYIRFMLPAWKAGFTAMWNVVKVVFNTIKGLIKNALQIIKGVVNVVMGVIKGDWGRAWKGIQQIVGGVWGYIKTLVSGGINLVKSVVSGGMNTLKGLWGSAWNAIKGLLQTAWNGIKNAVVSSVRSLIQTVTGIQGKIMNGLAGIATWLYQAGKDLIQGLINGVQDMAGNLADKVKDLADSAVGAVKGAFGIGSPSKVFKQIGRWVVEGLVNGIGEKNKDARKKAEQLVDAVIDGYKAATNKGRKATDRYFSQLTDWVKKVFTGKDRQDMLKRIREAGAKTRNLLKREAEVTRKLREAMAKKASLQEAKTSMVDAMRQGISGQANVLNAGNNAATIRQSLEAQVAKAREFVANLKRLKKMGFAKEVIAQVAAAGIEGGLAVSRALMAASPDDLAGINQAFGTINQIATQQSQALGNSLFDAGISAADGVIDGLKRKRKAIEQMFLNIAQGMEAAIRRALGLGNGKGGKGKDRNRTAERVSEALSGGMDTSPRRRPGGPGEGPGPLTPAHMGGGRGGREVHFHFNTKNPVAEPQSRTTNKALDRVSSLGLV